jgi:hypothetical protein
VLTRVVNVRGRYRSDLESDPQFLYVGRRCGEWPGSIWGNPIKVLPGTLNCRTPEQVVYRFHRFLGAAIEGKDELGFLDARTRKRFVVMAENLPSLRGKILGCWCGWWEPGWPEIPCHAVVLAQLANALTPEPEQASA